MKYLPMIFLFLPLQNCLNFTTTSKNTNPNCYVQTCHQIISGRNLRYSRALQIVQSEEYLNAVDKSIIKFHRYHHRVKRAIITLPVSSSTFCGYGTPVADGKSYDPYDTACVAQYSTCFTASAASCTVPTVITGVASATYTTTSYICMGSLSLQ